MTKAKAEPETTEATENPGGSRTGRADQQQIDLVQMVLLAMEGVLGWSGYNKYTYEAALKAGLVPTPITDRSYDEWCLISSDASYRLFEARYLATRRTHYRSQGRNQTFTEFLLTREGTVNALKLTVKYPELWATVVSALTRFAPVPDEDDGNGR